MIKRNFTFPLEVRATTEDKPVIAGYAAVFEPALSLDLGGFREKIKRDAFHASLSDASTDVMALWGHDWNQPIGRRSAGTLKLATDEHGLAVEIVPDGTSWSRDALEAVRSGNVRGMSFGFYVEQDAWDRQTKTRTLLKVRCLEVSLTAAPAYPDTEASVRSALTEVEASFAAAIPALRTTPVALATRHLQLLRLRG